MIVLASKSASRRDMLERAGVVFDTHASDVDERGLEAAMADAPGDAVALALAEAKALAVSAVRPGDLVLGSDSLVAVGGRRFDKPISRDDAAAQLRYYSGKVMRIDVAAALARDGVIVWSFGECATLPVRVLSEGFIQDYLATEWPALANSVGVFRIEGRGAQLFEAMDGDYFAVLGLPLLPVLNALRGFGELPS